MSRALFKGGPADGLELALIGGTPSYLLVIESPVPDHHASGMPWIIVGADFDDHWPGQQRYERAAFGPAANADDEPEAATVIYSHVDVETER